MNTTTSPASSPPVDWQPYGEELRAYFAALAANPVVRAAIDVDEYYRPIQDLLARAGSPVLVSNAGLLNAGKSTLFNALADQEGLFRTASTRCTRRRQFASLAALELVDTPGLDADEQDTTEAQEIYRQSQIILFVHSANAGEFDAQEVKALELLLKLYPDRAHRQKAIIPVLTKVQNVGDELPHIVDKIRSQWESITGGAPEKIFMIRAKTYLKGLHEEKPKLREHSQIPALRAYLSSLAADLHVHKDQLLHERINQILQTVDKDLRALSTRKQREKAEQRRQIERKISHLKQDIKDFADRQLQSFQRL